MTTTRHGTIASYWHDNCGCIDCYNAYKNWQYERLHSGKVPHGTATLYQYGCRCGDCREAARLAKRAAREKKRNHEDV
jgi:hypothetical protein